MAGRIWHLASLNCGLSIFARGEYRDPAGAEVPGWTCHLDGAAVGPLRMPRLGRGCVAQAPGAPTRSLTEEGSSPAIRSARVTSSSTARRLARTAIQTSCRCSALPRYSIDSGGEDWTWAIGPSTERTMSAIVTSSAGRASQ